MISWKKGGVYEIENMRVARKSEDEDVEKATKKRRGMARISRGWEG